MPAQLGALRIRGEGFQRASTVAAISIDCSRRHADGNATTGMLQHQAADRTGGTAGSPAGVSGYGHATASQRVGLIDTPGNQSPGRTQRSRCADIRPVGVKSSDPFVQVRDRSIVEAGSCSIVLRRYDRAGDRRTEDTGEPEKNGVYAAHRPVAPSR